MMQKSAVTRRSFIALAGFSVAGLGTGFTTAFALRHRTSSASAVARGVNAQLTFSGHQQTVRAVGWSPDGTMLASGSDDGQVIIWDPMGKIEARLAHPAPVLTLAWSPESQRVMTGAGQQVAFFKALTGTLLSRSTHTVSTVAWTPNNQMQAVSAGGEQAVVQLSITNRLYAAQCPDRGALLVI